MTREKTLQKLEQEIKEICTKYNLNLAVCDGRVALIDQSEKNLIALWELQPTATVLK